MCLSLILRSSLFSICTYEKEFTKEKEKKKVEEEEAAEAKLRWIASERASERSDGLDLRGASRYFAGSDARTDRHRTDYLYVPEAADKCLGSTWHLRTQLRIGPGP